VHVKAFLTKHFVCLPHLNFLLWNNCKLCSWELISNLTKYEHISLNGLPFTSVQRKISTSFYLLFILWTDKMCKKVAWFRTSSPPSIHHPIRAHHNIWYIYGHFTHEPRAMTMKLSKPKRKSPKAAPTHLHNHVVWSRALKFSTKSYVPGS